jgi:mRNA-degrading endonuclease RelE of RelBE toxin-antitoxin system
MQIFVTPSCERAIKKLHANQKKSLDKAIKAIVAKPEIGDPKVGDLEGIYVYKFKLVDKQWLLAYRVVSSKKSHSYSLDHMRTSIGSSRRHGRLQSKSPAE